MVHTSWSPPLIIKNWNHWQYFQNYLLLTLRCPCDLVITPRKCKQIHGVFVPLISTFTVVSVILFCLPVYRDFFPLCFSSVILLVWFLLDWLIKFLLDGLNVLYHLILSSGLEETYPVPVCLRQFDILSKIAKSGMMQWISACSKDVLP